jgi:RNA polymerase sigma-70 factor (ECF subfamily)
MSRPVIARFPAVSARSWVPARKSSQRPGTGFLFAWQNESAVATEVARDNIIMEQNEIIELVIQAQAGCRDAFGELAQQFEPTVYAIAVRRLRNEADAAELTQDVFIQALRKLRQLRQPERFAGWLRRITVRMAINRAVRKPPETASDPAVFGGVKCQRQSPLEDLMANERATDVWGGLKRLRDLDRKTLVAFYVEGQSLIEMSDRFNSPIGTIKRRLHTARIRLRDELAQMLQPA